MEKTIYNNYSSNSNLINSNERSDIESVEKTQNVPEDNILQDSSKKLAENMPKTRWKRYYIPYTSAIIYGIIDSELNTKTEVEKHYDDMYDEEYFITKILKWIKMKLLIIPRIGFYKKQILQFQTDFKNLDYSYDKKTFLNKSVEPFDDIYKFIKYCLQLSYISHKTETGNLLIHDSGWIEIMKNSLSATISHEDLTKKLKVPKLLIKDNILPLVYHKLSFSIHPKLDNIDTLDIYVTDDMLWIEILNIIVSDLLTLTTRTVIPFFEIYKSNSTLERVDFNGTFKRNNKNKYSYSLIFHDKIGDLQFNNQILINYVGESKIYSVDVTEFDFNKMKFSDLEDIIKKKWEIKGYIFFTLTDRCCQLSYKINDYIYPKSRYRYHHIEQTNSLAASLFSEKDYLLSKEKKLLDLGIEKSGIFIRVFDVTGPLIKAMYCSMVGCRHELEVNPSWNRKVLLKYAILLSPVGSNKYFYNNNFKFERKDFKNVKEYLSKKRNDDDWLYIRI